MLHIFCFGSRKSSECYFARKLLWFFYGSMHLITEAPTLTTLLRCDQLNWWASKLYKLITRILVFENYYYTAKLIFLGEAKDNFPCHSKEEELLYDDNGCSFTHGDFSRFVSDVDFKGEKSNPERFVSGQENPKRCKLDVKPRYTVNYICELVAVPGKMDIKKALDLGVPNGPQLGKLQKGQDVTLENGTVVKIDKMYTFLGGKYTYRHRMLD